VAIMTTFGTCIATIIATLFAGEIKAWLPWMTKRVIALAVRILPRDQRERYNEEWLSFIDETPGDIAKLLTVTGFVFAGLVIRLQTPAQAPIEVNEKIAPDYERATFGLLPETKRSPRSFFISVVINGLFLAMILGVKFTVPFGNVLLHGTRQVNNSVNSANPR